MSKKTLVALEKAAMCRYRQLAKKHPVEYATIVAGDNCDLDPKTVALIRACAAHAKSLKGKPK